MATADKKVGIVGLGDMGSGIVNVLARNGYSLVLLNRTKDKYAKFASNPNVYGASDKKDFVDKLRNSGKSITVCTMVNPGKATNDTISELSEVMRKDDIVIDGSNSNYDESIANYRKLKEKGIFHLDVGFGGGPEDILHGFTLMVGGDRRAFEDSEHIFKDLCGEGAYGYVGEAGSGKKAKLAHNLIFYGIFPVYAEVATLLSRFEEKSPDFDLNEAFRLLSVSPPITSDIPEAMYKVFKQAQNSNESPKVTVSTIVSDGSKQAKEIGVQLNVLDSILEHYDTMSDDTKRYYAAAKKIITGH